MKKNYYLLNGKKILWIQKCHVSVFDVPFYCVKRIILLGCCHEKPLTVWLHFASSVVRFQFKITWAQQMLCSIHILFLSFVSVIALSPCQGSFFHNPSFTLSSPNVFVPHTPSLPLLSLCSLNETQICQVAMSQCLPSPLFLCLLVDDAIIFTSLS